jgi:protein involved in polysaccharide export with SLBB domain
MPGFLVATAHLLLAVLAACGTPQAPASPQPSFSAEDALPEEYEIQVGDHLGIKFFFNDTLNEEVIVRTDGRISLQLIPEIVAAGRTPAGLAELLEQQYSEELQDPEIAVIVRTSAQRIFVDGEVEKPGEFALMGPLTVMQAIAQAGGLTEGARPEEVIVIRRRNSGEPEVIPFDLEAARAGEDPSQSIALEPFDVVYVPRSTIRDVNVWVDQYIRKNIPITFRPY